MERLAQWNDAAQKWQPRFCAAAPTYLAMWDAMAKKLATYERIFPDEEKFVQFFTRTCNTCRKWRSCPKAAQWGDPVRYNCAIYEPHERYEEEDNETET